MSTPVGNGPDNTGLIVLGNQLQPVKEYNRADFDVLAQTGNSPAPSSWMAQGLALLSSALPVVPTVSIFQQYQENGQQAVYTAVGVMAQASFSGRVRTLLNLAGVSGGWSRAVSRFLPELTAGFSIGWDDNQTLIAGSVQVGLPKWIEQQFSAWKRSLTVSGVDPDILMDTNFQLSSQESWLSGDLYSRVDAVDGISGGFVFTNKSTGLGFNVQFSSEMSKWSVVLKVDGATRLVNIYRRSAKVDAQSVTDLQNINVTVGPNGEIGEPEWTIADASGRPLDVDIVRDSQGNYFIGETNITEGAKDSGLYNALNNAMTSVGPDGLTDIIVTGKPFDITRRYDLGNGNILNKCPSSEHLAQIAA